MEYIVAKIGIHGAKATVLESNDITRGLTGAKVQLIYDDDLWSGLRKEITFKGVSPVTPIITDETLVELPQQVTLAKNMPVSIGVTGINAKGTIQIPTVWATIGTVKDSGYGDYPPPAAPLKPEWAQVAAMVGTLSNLNTETKENLVAAINEVLGKVGTGGGNLDLSGYVKSVNGVTPDKDGNVKITIPDSSQNATLSEAEKTLILTLFRNAAYVSDNMGDTLTQLETLWGGGGEEPENPDIPDIPDEPDEPVTPTVTLTSISATYIGGDVAVGTAVTALTGIVVTAHYSDGTSETVTGYTLSGSIAEGENTVTVSYGGKTTTFTVTGVAESGGSDAVNLYSGTLETCTGVSNSVLTGNVLSYDVAEKNTTVRTTIEGLQNDVTYTIFVENDIDGTTWESGKGAAATVTTTQIRPSTDKLGNNIYPTYVNAGKKYTSFTATGETLYFWVYENNIADAGIGTKRQFSVYVYEGTLTERP
jgi:hypothetical protein